MRYMQKGTTQFHWVPTITLSAPTAVQVIAGEDLTSEVAEVNGFMFTNNPIPTPDMGSTFVGNIPGEDTAENSSLVFYEHKDTGNNPILDALVKGDDGNVVILPWGSAGAIPAAADVVDIWPSEIASKSRAYSAGNEAAKVTVAFAMTAEPVLEEALV